MGNLTVAEFWRQQDFAYLETYSFNRGPASVEEYERLNQEIAAIKEALASGRPMLRSRVSRQLRDLEEEMVSNKPGIALPDPAVSSSSTTQKIATLTYASPAFNQLSAVMSKASRQEALSNCIPIYRDAVVFCSEQCQQVRVLNVCFECLNMVTDNKQIVEANFATYEALRAFLIKLGHPIERR